jgi:hypothetical protein
MLKRLNSPLAKLMIMSLMASTATQKPELLP